MKLKDICKITMGQSPEGTTYNKLGKGLPFLQGNRTFGNLYPAIDTWCTAPSRTAEKGTILLSVRAPVGDVNFSDRKICIGRGLCSIDAGRFSRYLYYWLKLHQKTLEHLATGTTFRSIGNDEISEIEIENFSERRATRIGDLLFALDSRIELSKRINDNLSNSYLTI